MTSPSAELVFTALGGTEQIGMNCYLYGLGTGPDGYRWLMVDCGISFPDDRHPGVDLILPDTKFIEQRRDQLCGLVLTHAHEDHVGAIPYLWKRLGCPVYGTPFTIGFLRRKLREEGLLDQVPINEIPCGGKFSVGPFALEYVPMTHSIPEAQALVVAAEGQRNGLVLHSGDWKLDPDPVIGQLSDLARLAQLGEQGVSTLICDSTNALSPGRAGSEGSLLQPLSELFARCSKRIVVTCFASNVARLVTLTRAAAAVGRHVGLVGRSLYRMVDTARESGYLDDDISFVSESDLGVLPDDKLVILSTGSQGETQAALARIARREHRHVQLGPGDICVFSSRIIPGNERAVGRVQNLLLQQGVEVITWRDHHVHVPGHPAREELIDMYRLTKPTTVVPMHGERLHMDRNGQIARDCGVQSVVIPHNGAMLRLWPGVVEQVGEVESGSLISEGDRLLDLNGGLHRGRKKALYAGSAVATVVVNGSGQLVNQPHLTTQGLFENQDEQQIVLDGVFDAVSKAVANLPLTTRSDDAVVAEEARIAIRRVLRRWTGKKPVTNVHVVRV